MKILVSGATGLIGGAVVRLLEPAGHTVLKLTRSAAGPQSITWDPVGGRLDPGALEGFDAVVHLAGENIAAGRWTAAKKQSLRDSRVRGTHTLCAAIEKLSNPPK